MTKIERKKLNLVTERSCVVCFPSFDVKTIVIGDDHVGREVLCGEQPVTGPVDLGRAAGDSRSLEGVFQGPVARNRVLGGGTVV